MAADNLVELIFKARTKDAHQNVRALGKDLSNIGNEAQTAGRQAASGMKRTANETRRARNSTQRYNKEIDAQRGSIGDLRYRINRLTKARDKFADPKVIERYNRKIEELNTEMRGLQNAQPGGKGQQSFLGSAAGFAGRLAAGAGAVMAFQRGISRAISKGSEFETTLADLEAITGITGDQLDELGDRSIELSKEYGTSASEIVEANKLVASQLAQKIDFGTEEGMRQLQEVSEQAVVLKTAAGIELSDAVETTTSVINQFNMAASESDRVINTLAAGSKYGAAEVPAIGRALVNAGSAAASANQSIETTNAAIQVLAQNGQVGERAGTALRAIFTRLRTESEALANAGISNVNVEANGLVETLHQLEPLLEDTAAAKKIFGEEALNQIQILIRNADAVGDLEEKVTDTQTAYEQSEVNLQTYEKATGRLSATIDSALIPAFTETSGATVQLINGVSSLIEQFAGGIGVINEWVDTHSELRKEIDEQEHSSNSHLNAMKELREELTEYAEQGDLTAQQEAELRESFNSTQEAIRNRASDLFDDTYALKQQREEVQANIEELEKHREERQEMGLGLSPEDNIDLKMLREDLEELNLEISSNEKQLDNYTKALEDGSMGFDEYIEKVRELKEAQEDDDGGDGDDSEEAKGLSEQIKALKEEYELLINQPNISDQDLFRAEGLIDEWQKLEDQLEDVRERTGSIKDEDVDIEGELEGFNEGLTEDVVDQEEAHHEQRMTWLEEEKQKRLETENQVQQSRQAGWQDYVQAISGAVSNIAGLFSAQHQRRIDQLEQEKEQRLENVNAELAQENLSEKRRQQLLQKRKQLEEQYQEEINAEKRKQFALEKKANIAEATMAGAIAIAEAWKNPWLVPIVAAATAAQIATVAAQENPYEKGGWIGGKRHRDGGTIIEAEKDEFITNRRSAPEASRTLGYINRGPAEARRVESMFDQWASGQMPRAKQGGFVGSPPPRTMTAGGGSEFDYEQFARVMRSELEAADLRADMPGVDAVDEGLQRLRKKKQRVGN